MHAPTHNKVVPRWKKTRLRNKNQLKFSKTDSLNFTLQLFHRIKNIHFEFSWNSHFYKYRIWVNPSSGGTETFFKANLFFKTRCEMAKEESTRCGKFSKINSTCNAVVIQPRKMNGNVLSKTSTSLLKRLSSRPVGVVSKNTIGRRRTSPIRRICKVLAARNVARPSRTEATIITKAIQQGQNVHENLNATSNTKLPQQHIERYKLRQTGLSPQLEGFKQTHLALGSSCTQKATVIKHKKLFTSINLEKSECLELYALTLTNSTNMQTSSKYAGCRSHMQSTNHSLTYRKKA